MTNQYDIKECPVCGSGMSLIFADENVYCECGKCKAYYNFRVIVLSEVSIDKLGV